MQLWSCMGNKKMFKFPSISCRYINYKTMLEYSISIHKVLKLGNIKY